MDNSEPLEIRGFFRAHSHLPLWEVLEEAGIWRQVGLKVSLEFCNSPAVAEAALFDGSIDFVSGNHITPYALVARNKPIVCLASPSNSVQAKLVSRRPISSLGELRGRRVGDTAVVDNRGEFHHPRGNHMLYLMRAGLDPDEVEWVDLTDSAEEFRHRQFAALESGQVDASFVGGGAEKFEQAGFHVLDLGPLPMINGPTLTTTTETLRRRAALGERLVKAMVLGICFARSRREETEAILERLNQRLPQARRVGYRNVAKFLPKPYPALEGVANAHKLCCLKAPEAAEISPLKLWDLHYLRELDDSGFIDRLYPGGSAR